MSLRNSANIFRLKPRRQDAGAAVMRQFRESHGGSVEPGRLRVSDVLVTVTVTMICATAAIILNDGVGDRWSRLVTRIVPTENLSEALPVSTIASRIAPASPVFDVPEIQISAPSVPRVRLTQIEEEPDSRLITLPASVKKPVRMHEEFESPATSASAAAHQPLRAALHLGDQPARFTR